MRLAGKTALVTGTARGLGPAIARALADEGARVLCHARRLADAERCAADVGGVPLAGDLATREGVEACASAALAAAPTLHVVVHNAGLLHREAFLDASVDALREELAVHVEAPFVLLQRLRPALAAARPSSVVLISSQLGQLSRGLGADTATYRVSKAAESALALVASHALRPDGVAVNAMHPGWIRTDMGGAGAEREPGTSAGFVRDLVLAGLAGTTGTFRYEDREEAF